MEDLLLLYRLDNIDFILDMPVDALTQAQAGAACQFSGSKNARGVFSLSLAKVLDFFQAVSLRISQGSDIFA
jgi:hypothetical protein